MAERIITMGSRAREAGNKGSNALNRQIVRRRNSNFPLGTTRAGAMLGECGRGHEHHPKEAPIMCDYSLHSVLARSAMAGDNLVTTSFPGTATRGFAAADAPTVAVCLLPGTEIAFE